MIEWIIEKSVKNRFLIPVFAVVILAIGGWAMVNTPVDAIPDLSDVQVIVFTEYPGQAPQVVEDQVTYPLTTAMLSVPYAKTVRGYSFFGFSMVLFSYQAPPLVVAIQLSGLKTVTVTKFCLMVTLTTTLFLLPIDFLWWRLLGWI